MNRDDDLIVLKTKDTFNEPEEKIFRHLISATGDYARIKSPNPTSDMPLTACDVPVTAAHIARSLFVLFRSPECKTELLTQEEAEDLEENEEAIENAKGRALLVTNYQAREIILEILDIIDLSDDQIRERIIKHDLFFQELSKEGLSSSQFNLPSRPVGETFQKLDLTTFTQKYGRVEQDFWRATHVLQVLEEYNQIGECESVRQSAGHIANSLYLALQPVIDSDVLLTPFHELTANRDEFAAAERKANTLADSEGKRVLLKILGVLRRTPEASDDVIKTVLKKEHDFFEALSSNEFPLDQRESQLQVHSKLRKVRGRVLPFRSEKDHHHSGLDIRERGHD